MKQPDHHHLNPKHVGLKRCSLPRRAAIMLGMLLIGLIGSRALQAHPHVWVSVRSTLLFAASGEVMGVRHVWTFDEAYSAFLSQGLDTNGDGMLSREELAELAKVNVESLADMGYFTTVKGRGKHSEFGSPADYFLEQVPGKLLALHFTLPLKQPVANKTIALEVVDPTFFVSFVMVDGEEAVRLSNAPAGCSMTVNRAKGTSIGEQIPLSESQLSNAAPLELTVQFANRAIIACP
jgi:ABC-type uncharacterized transport system substrate-binding protein